MDLLATVAYYGFEARRSSCTVSVFTVAKYGYPWFTMASRRGHSSCTVNVSTVANCGYPWLTRRAAAARPPPCSTPMHRSLSPQARLAAPLPAGAHLRPYPMGGGEASSLLLLWEALHDDIKVRLRRPTPSPNPRYCCYGRRYTTI